MSEMKAYKPSKKTRRKVIASSLVFCATIIGFTVFEGGNDQTRVAALYASFAFASSIVWFYINGSSKDTESFNNALVNLKGKS